MGLSEVYALEPMTAECCDACMHQKPITAMMPPTTVTVTLRSDEPEIVVNPDESSSTLTEPLIKPSSESSPYVECVDDEEPLQKKRRRRRRRRVRMVLGGILGITVGAIVFCEPAGLVFGTIAGAAGARQLSKRGERKKDARMARAKAAQGNLEELSKPVFA
jgi:hypothetical protein